ncbi:hypothetical protein SAMN02745194_01802 [Roseomonas rosea]|uniref:Uncharacterized protein n=1 Tax=Muricoccus roseus TaxID=198092 RepID=A0A1M6GTU0_9PROT|nr:hypothetical protein [Roseomonas rosea]SHJ13376.1 hypothetical protein SAMN02745194_01802 [Roseomonas rosea]
MFELFTLGALASALVGGAAHPAAPEADFIAGPVPSRAWSRGGQHDAAAEPGKDG